MAFIFICIKMGSFLEFSQKTIYMFGNNCNVLNPNVDKLVKKSSSNTKLPILNCVIANIIMINILFYMNIFFNILIWFTWMVGKLVMWQILNPHCHFQVGLSTGRWMSSCHSDQIKWSKIKADAMLTAWFPPGVAFLLHSVF